MFFLFSDYFELKKHFADKHFLCEEGNCKEARFTNAFSNELDLRSHRMQYHGNIMSKEELRECAKLDLALFSQHSSGSPNLPRREYRDNLDAGERGSRISRHERRLQEIRKEKAILETPENSETTSSPGPVPSGADFPTLEGSAGNGTKESSKAASNSSKSVAERIALSTRSHNVGKTPKVEDFPALPSVSSNSPKNNNRPLVTQNRFPVAGKGTRSTPAKSSQAQGFSQVDTGGKFKPSSKKASSISNNMRNEDPFPALISYREVDDVEYIVNGVNNGVSKSCSTQQPAKASHHRQDQHKKAPIMPASDEFPALLTDSPTDDSTAFETVEQKHFKYSGKTSTSSHLTKNTTKIPPGFGAKSVSGPQQVPARLDVKSSLEFPELQSAAVAMKSKGPPPGFSEGKNSVPSKAKGENKQHGTDANKCFVFWKPEDYDKRNKALQSAVTKQLNIKTLDEFRNSSRRFREGVNTAFDFLSKCVDIFPKKQLGFIISEMVILLPDFDKQQALLAAISTDSLLSTLVPHLLSSCSICSQVVSKRDEAVHRQSHAPKELSDSGLPLSDSSTAKKIDLSNYIVGKS